MDSELTETELQIELSKCVSCCNLTTKNAGNDYVDICNRCYSTVKCQLPIPPQCLDMEVPRSSSLWYISTAPRGVNMSQVGKKWKAHMRASGWLE